MTRTLTRAALVAGTLFAVPVVHSASPQKPQIVELDAALAKRGVTVSFRVQSAFTADSLERIASGMEVEFRHRVELLVRRAIPVWPSRVLSRVEISVSIHYDSLTHQYKLTRSIEREVDGKPVEGAEGLEELLTPSQDEAQEWMTRVDALTLSLPEREWGDRAPRLHVRSWFGRRYRFYLFPMADAVEAERELTK